MRQRRDRRLGGFAGDLPQSLICGGDRGGEGLACRQAGFVGISGAARCRSRWPAARPRRPDRRCGRCARFPPSPAHGPAPPRPPRAHAPGLREGAARPLRLAVVAGGEIAERRGAHVVHPLMEGDEARARIVLRGLRQIEFDRRVHALEGLVVFLEALEEHLVPRLQDGQPHPRLLVDDAAVGFRPRHHLLHQFGRRGILRPHLRCGAPRQRAGIRQRLLCGAARGLDMLRRVRRAHDQPLSGTLAQTSSPRRECARFPTHVPERRVCRESCPVRNTVLTMPPSISIVTSADDASFNPTGRFRKARMVPPAESGGHSAAGFLSRDEAHDLRHAKAGFPAKDGRSGAGTAGP